MPLQEQDHILIEKYLLQQLTAVDQSIFDQRLNDPDFQKELELQKDLMVALRAEGRSQLKDQLQNIEQRIQREEDVQVTTPQHQFRIARIMAIAASVALILAAIYFFSNQKKSGGQIFAQHFEPYPNIVAPLNKSNPETGNREKAFHAYELKNYEEAIQLLNGLPKSDTTHFYIGLANLSLNQPQKAIDFFDKIKKKDSPFYIPMNWYKALTLINSEKANDAKPLILFVKENAKTPGMLNKANLLLDDLD
ncbi:MAG: hypothetical protein MK226_23310 [Saprospiraceae bacterium]|nr:hypothetical protein [Saprospiraceae bacterium]